jgi:hypothetical protein
MKSKISTTHICQQCSKHVCQITFNSWYTDRQYTMQQGIKHEITSKNKQQMPWIKAG